MTEPAMLWWTAAPEPIDLQSAVAAVTGLFAGGATAFLSSPDDHVVAALSDGQLRTSSGQVELDGVFAARVFGPPGELRWLQTGGGLGDAVFLCEEPGQVAGWHDRPADVVDRLPNSYALWGRQLRQGPTPGWLQAKEGRIGWIDLPLDAQHAETPPDQEWPNQYVSLKSVEYFGLDEHHNLRLVEERLVELALAEPTSGKGA